MIRFARLRPHRLSAMLAVLCLAAAACTTQVVERPNQPLTYQTRDLTVSVLNVRFAYALGDAVQPEAQIALEGAVRQRLRPTRRDARPADMVVIIDRAAFATQAQRGALGVFAGSDVLDVRVVLMDQSTRATLAEFAVTGAYNQGGAGAFRDPVQAAANAVADAIAKRLGPGLMVPPTAPGN